MDWHFLKALSNLQLFFVLRQVRDAEFRAAAFAELQGRPSYFAVRGEKPLKSKGRPTDTFPGFGRR